MTNGGSQVVVHHVSTITFADDKKALSEDGRIYNALMHMGKKSDIGISFALLESYDIDYDIFNHDDPNVDDPMAIVLQHPAEDMSVGSPLELAIKELLECDLPNKTNTPLMELLEYPPHLLNSMIKDAKKQVSDEYHANLNKVNELANQLK